MVGSHAGSVVVVVGAMVVVVGGAVVLVVVGAVVVVVVVVSDEVSPPHDATTMARTSSAVSRFTGSPSASKSGGQYQVPGTGVGCGDPTSTSGRPGSRRLPIDG
jgi:hypothetical protein